MPRQKQKQCGRLCVAGLAFAICVGIGGCQSSAHSSDGRLKKIDEMLATELPRGTGIARVGYFLDSRGYRIVDTSKPQTMVAIVRQIDTETLRPANARVTFHFDAQGQLTSYELTSAPDELPHP